MRVMLVVDVPGWAWDHKADALIKNLPQFKINKIYLKNFKRKHINKFDSVHFFGWLDASQNHNIVTSAISSFNYKLIHRELARKVLPKFSAITAVSKQLYEILKEEQLNKHIYYCANGVDENLFYPKKKTNDKEFVVGWVSQISKGGFSNRPIDIKGHQHVLLPLIQKLKSNKNIKIKKVSNNHTNCIKHAKMRNIYHGIDLFLSTSFREGTPNPAFEAASCGKAVLAPEVGCLPELITNGVNGILVPAYNGERDLRKKDIVGKLYDNIIKLSNDRELCNDMGEKNRKEIEKNWTWKERAKQWIPVFENHRTK